MDLRGRDPTQGETLSKYAVRSVRLFLGKHIHQYSSIHVKYVDRVHQTQKHVLP